MKIIRPFAIFFLVFFFFRFAWTQEFKVSVVVNSARIEGTDRKIFESMQTDLNEFVNTRRWTNYTFEPNEKIEGSLIFNIKERISQEDFKADLNIQLRRPVYGTSYHTSLLNTQENDFVFKYVESVPLEYDLNTYYSDLTSTVAFYLYYFLALDFGSFSSNGGKPFFDHCQTIASLAQKSGSSGWQPFANNKNKYWMAENYTNSAYSMLHLVLYKYHRLGMDHLAGDNPSEARNEIIEAIELVRRAHQEKSTLVAVQQFIDAKADEIVNIFKEAPAGEKSRVFEMLVEINPSGTSKFEQMKQNQFSPSFPSSIKN